MLKFINFLKKKTNIEKKEIQSLKAGIVFIHENELFLLLNCKLNSPTISYYEAVNLENGNIKQFKTDDWVWVVLTEELDYNIRHNPINLRRPEKTQEERLKILEDPKFQFWDDWFSDFVCEFYYNDIDFLEYFPCSEYSKNINNPHALRIAYDMIGKIKSLENEIKTLKNEIDFLENENLNLKSRMSKLDIEI